MRNQVMKKHSCHKSSFSKTNQQNCYYKHHIKKQNFIRHDIKAQMSPVDTSYYVGKSITLFTMLYCGLNWLYYSKIASEVTSDSEANEKNKSKKLDSKNKTDNKK